MPGGTAAGGVKKQSESVPPRDRMTSGLHKNKNNHG